jgi:hypothetical protein
VFGRFSFGSFKPATGKKPLMQELMTHLPHWVFIRNTLPDQDTVVNVKQVRRDQRQACAGTTHHSLLASPLKCACPRPRMPVRLPFGVSSIAIV